MSITDLKGFIKPPNPAQKRDVLVLILIVLSGLGGFAVGKLSDIFTKESPIQVERRAASALVFLEDREEGTLPLNRVSVPEGAGSVVASKGGSKYHFPWCAGARSIKDENKVWFKSAEEARTEGYQPATNCKGLK